jgi:hypothetical protein
MQEMKNNVLSSTTTNTSFDTETAYLGNCSNYSIHASYDNLTPTFTFATTDVAPVYVTSNAHGLFTGNVIQVTTDGTRPAPLAASTNYYVIRLGANTFQLASSLANAHAAQPLSITSQGTGTHTFTPATPPAVTVAETALAVAAKTVTKTAHGFATGMKLQVTSDDTLPTGYTALTDFFVVRIDADTFKLSDTEAHALAGTNIVDPVNDGTGNHTFTITAQSAATAAYTAVTVGDTTITEASHGILVGVKGQLTTTTTLPAGLSGGTDYWVIPISANKIRLASSLSNAQAGIFVNITDVGTGTHTFTGTTLSMSIQPQVSNDPDNLGWALYGSATSVSATGDTMYDIPTDYKWARLAVTMTAGQVTFKATDSGQG